jgi:hypothetical protein
MTLGKGQSEICALLELLALDDCDCGDWTLFVLRSQDSGRSCAGDEGEGEGDLAVDVDDVDGACREWAICAWGWWNGDSRQSVALQGFLEELDGDADADSLDSAATRAS